MHLHLKPLLCGFRQGHGTQHALFDCYKHDKRSLSDCNWTRTPNHLVHKRPLNHLDKLAK